MIWCPSNLQRWTISLPFLLVPLWMNEIWFSGLQYIFVNLPLVFSPTFSSCSLLYLVILSSEMLQNSVKLIDFLSLCSCFWAYSRLQWLCPLHALTCPLFLISKYLLKCFIYSFSFFQCLFFPLSVSLFFLICEGRCVLVLQNTKHVPIHYHLLFF